MTIEAVSARSRWLALPLLILPCFAYALDLTVLTLAVPKLTAQFRPSPAELLWILDIYGFVIAGLLVPMGVLGDRVGRRRILLIGSAIFVAASICEALSASAVQLIAARGLLGVGGATLAPSSLSLVRSVFSNARERSIAIAIWVASFSLGGAAGPVLGGVILEYYPWRVVFLLSLPLLTLLLCLGGAVLPELKNPKSPRIDLPSVALFLPTVFLLVAGLKELAQGGNTIRALAAVAVATVLAISFGRRQATAAQPLFDPKLLAPSVTPLVIYAVVSFVCVGTSIILGQYLQLVLGLHPLEAGLWLLPFSIVVGLGGLLTPLIRTVLEPRVIIPGGLLVAAVGFLMVALVTESSSPSQVALACCLYGLGVAPVLTLSTELVMSRCSVANAGVISAVSETSGELGSALGIAVLGSIATAVYRFSVAANHTTKVAFVGGLHAVTIVSAGLLLVSALAARRSLARLEVVSSIPAAGDL